MKPKPYAWLYTNKHGALVMHLETASEKFESNRRAAELFPHKHRLIPLYDQAALDAATEEEHKNAVSDYPLMLRAVCAARDVIEDRETLQDDNTRRPYSDLKQALESLAAHVEASRKSKEK